MRLQHIAPGTWILTHNGAQSVPYTHAEALAAYMTQRIEWQTAPAEQLDLLPLDDVPTPATARIDWRVLQLLSLAVTLAGLMIAGL